MEAQDATTIYLLKLWPRIEANKNRIIAGIALVAVAAGIIWFLSVQQEQKAVSAGEALTKLAVAQNTQPEAFLKVAADYPGTAAAQRAQLQAATLLFAAGKYPEAQTQFEKYLDEHSDGEWVGQAQIGAAASLEALGKVDQAVAYYQKAVNSPSDPITVAMAKLALGKLFEAQGKLNNAQLYYEEVAKGNPNNTLGQEATLRYMELKNKMPATPAPAPAPAPAPVIVTKPPTVTVPLAPAK